MNGWVSRITTNHSRYRYKRTFGLLLIHHILQVVDISTEEKQA